MQCLRTTESPCAGSAAQGGQDSRTLERFAARSTILKALAHPSRLLMVDTLTQGEKCVCDLAALVGCDISTASKHLGVLKAAGIVKDQKRGLQVYYSLRMRCVQVFLSCTDELIAENARERIRLTDPEDGRSNP